jgi:hypothetical protein
VVPRFAANLSFWYAESSILSRRRPVLTVILFLIITAIAAAFARRVLSRFEPDFDSAGERLVFESVIGLGLLGILVFILGVLQLFYLPAFAGLLLLMAAVSWRAFSGVISDAISGLKALRKIRLNGEAVVFGIILTGIGFFALVRAFAPPIGDDWDSLAYHLAIPKLFLKHHGIYYIDFCSHSNFPFTWEMLYTLGLSFGSVSLAKLFHFGAGALLIAAVYSLGKRHFSQSVGRLAALIVAGIPLVAWEATTGYVDLATALYSVLTVYGLMNYSSSRDRRWAILAGMTAGMAAGTKMTALIMIPVTAVWVIWLGFAARQEPHPPKSQIRDPKSEIPPDSAFGTPHSAFKSLVVIIGLATIIAMPWYIKSFIYTGNPVYPFAYGVFGGKNWSSETATVYREDQMKFGKVPDNPSAVMLPWNLTFRFARFNDYGARLPNLPELGLLTGSAQGYLSSVGPMLLISLPMIGLAVLRRGRHRPLLMVSIVLMATWFITMQNSRYLIPALGILAPAIAASADLTKVRKVIFALAAALGVFTVALTAIFAWPSIPVAFGIEKPSVYLSSKLDLYPVSTFVNENLPRDSKIALFGETRGFYLDRDYIWADAGHNALIPYASFGSDPGKLLGWLRSKGIDYVLINHGVLPPDTLIGRAAGHGLDEICSSCPGSDRSISVYRISD